MQRFRILASCAALLAPLLLASEAASAKASSYRFFERHTEVVTETLECLPTGLFGTATVTETSTGHVVDRPNGGLSINGLNEFDYRLELPGGAYVEGGLNRDRYVFVLTSRSHIVFHVTVQDFRTIYDADGTPVGKISIHGGMHITYDDTNGNFEPDSGEISTEHDFFRVRCM